MCSAGLCERREWSEPIYQVYRTRHGYICTAIVNNRAYMADSESETPDLAREAAATQAYLQSRQFSLNNGTILGQSHQEVVFQELPASIGASRERTVNLPHGYPQRGHESPAASETGSGGRSNSGSPVTAYSCPCGQLPYGRYNQCATCLRQGIRR